jgi:two-component system nitrate/nitrite response regulator NarL
MGNPTKLKVLIVDDHPLVIESLRLLLQTDKKYSIVGMAVNGESGLKLARRKKPDLIVLDLTLPDLDGIDVARKVRKTLPGTRIVILTGFQSRIKEAIDAGAHGAMLKPTPASEIIEGIRIVANGGRYFDQATSRILDELAEHASDLPELTAAELEIARSVAAGETSKDIARKREGSVRTIEKIRARVMQKFKVKNAAGLASKVSQYFVQRD